MNPEYVNLSYEIKCRKVSWTEELPYEVLAVFDFGVPEIDQSFWTPEYPEWHVKACTALIDLHKARYHPKFEYIVTRKAKMKVVRTEYETMIVHLENQKKTG